MSFTGWLFQIVLSKNGHYNLPCHMIFLHCDFDTHPIGKWGLCSSPLEFEKICDCSGSDAIWHLRLGHKKVKLPPGSLWTFSVGTWPRYSQEAQAATWRSRMEVFWLIISAEVPACSHHQLSDMWALGMAPVLSHWVTLNIPLFLHETPDTVEQRQATLAVPFLNSSDTETMRDD